MDAIDEVLDEQGYDGGSVVSAWQSDTLVPWLKWPMEEFTGGVTGHGPMTLDELNAFVSAVDGSGEWIIHVGAGGAGAEARFCAITAAEGLWQPLPRKWIAISMGAASIPTAPLEDVADNPFDEGLGPMPDPSLPDPSHDPDLGAKPKLEDVVSWDLPSYLPPKPPATFVQLLKGIQQKTGAKRGQLVVQRNGEAVYALAATLAEDNYPPPDHHKRLRIGSVSKMLTGIGACKYAGPNAAHGVTLTTSVFDALEVPLPTATLRSRSRTPPTSSRFDSRSPCGTARGGEVRAFPGWTTMT